MKKLLLLMFTLSLVIATILSAKTLIPYGDKFARNWSQKENTIYLQVNEADLKNKLDGASKLWVFISARRQNPGFWNHYPEFVEKCVVSKQIYDFKWIEAVEIPIKDVTTNQFKIKNAEGAYYGFVLVENDGDLAIVKPGFIGAEKDFNKSWIKKAKIKKKAKSIKVKIPKKFKLKRDWSDDAKLSECA